MNKLSRVLLLSSLAAVATASGCGGRMSTRSGPPPRIVEKVELERYAGTWYEIGRLPFRQQEGCHATTATYTPLDDGRIQVLNRCRDGSLDGPVREATARARPVDSTNARLKVTFFWPFSAPYWILALDRDYRWAMVGTPNRRYLWLLSREPTMPPEVFSTYLRQAAAEGYAVEDLILTPQEGVDLERYSTPGEE